MLETLRERLLSVQQDFTLRVGTRWGRKGARTPGRGAGTPPPRTRGPHLAPATPLTQPRAPIRTRAGTVANFSGVGPAARSNLGPGLAGSDPRAGAGSGSGRLRAAEGRATLPRQIRPAREGSGERRARPRPHEGRRPCASSHAAETPAGSGRHPLQTAGARRAFCPPRARRLSAFLPLDFSLPRVQRLSEETLGPEKRQNWPSCSCPSGDTHADLAVPELLFSESSCNHPKGACPGGKATSYLRLRMGVRKTTPAQVIPVCVDANARGPGILPLSTI